MGNVGGGFHGPSDCLSVPATTVYQRIPSSGFSLVQSFRRWTSARSLHSSCELQAPSRSAFLCILLSLSPETDVTFSDGALSFSNVGLPTVNGACSCDGLLSAAITTYAGLCDTRIETGVPEFC